MSEQVIDHGALETIRSLQSPGAEDILSKILSLFLTDSESLYEQIALGLESSDAAKLRDASHTLKSSSASVGATKVAKLCADLEEKAKAEELQNIGHLLASLRSELSAANDELGAILQNH